MENVYLKAAEIIQNWEHEFSCLAIKKACGGYKDDSKYFGVQPSAIPEAELYVKMFGLENFENGSNLSELYLLTDDDPDAARELRIWMLLMMQAYIDVVSNESQPADL